VNEGILAIIIIVATMGAAVWAVLYRDLIWPTLHNSTSRPAARVISRPGRAPSAPPRRSPTLAETAPKPSTTISTAVSGVATPNDETEMIAFRVLAKLIAADLVTETAALQAVFDVRAGSSKRYKEVQAKLKAAQAEVESSSPRIV